MFNFFKKSKNICPIDEETRIWMENALIWLIKQFGEDRITKEGMILPTQDFFPLKFDGSKQIALQILNIVSTKMNIDPNKILLEFYNEQLLEIKSDTGFSLFTQQYEDGKYSSGLYGGEDTTGKFLIALETSQLSEPEKLIATLAHELAHIKILGEGRLKENDEYLTDLTTVFFGFGIFNANASFKFYSGYDKWSYSKQGYLTQQEWGYALALYSYIRYEETPAWLQYITPNIQSDFKKSYSYIKDNTDKVLV